jgi:hypothetical protein
MSYTYSQGSDTVVVDYMGLFDMVFSTNEPVVYIGSTRLPMYDGVRIRNGRPHINFRDMMTKPNSPGL